MGGGDKSIISFQRGAYAPPLTTPAFCKFLPQRRRAINKGFTKGSLRAGGTRPATDRVGRRGQGVGLHKAAFSAGETGVSTIKLTPGRHSRPHDCAPPALAQPQYKSGAEIAAFAFWCVYVLSFTILLSAEAILSTSCSVLFFPREMRIVPAACSSSSPMAWSTWDILKQRERGALIVVSCHDRDFLDDVSDVIYHIQEGRIIDEA